MQSFIQKLVGNDLISSIIVSFIPLIELKGGIVFARGVGFSFFEALSLCYLGSTVAFFPVFFLLKPILALLSKNKAFSRFSEKVQAFFSGKAEKVEKNGDGKFTGSEKRATFYKQLGVFIFVSIPLPMTGVWTGTAIAVFLNLKFKDACLPVLIGNAVAGIIMSLLVELFITFFTVAALDYVLWGLFALAAIILCITIYKLATTKPHQR